MLTIATVRRERCSYYLAALSDEAGHDAVEEPGRWYGSGARALGLHDVPITARDLEMVLVARAPDGAPLLPAGDRRRNLAFDCTFTCPKSVSLLAAVAPPALAHAAEHAHVAAVSASVDYLERAVLSVRRSRGRQRTSEPARGLIAAALVHRASRAPDPHLHTHLLVANLARDAAGTASALDVRRLFDERGLAAGLYEAELRWHLARDLGVAFQRDERGVADLVGVPADVRRAFSRRSEEIAAALAPTGRFSPRAVRIAAAATRPSKDASWTRRALEADWSLRAGALGLSPAHWAHVAPGRQLASALDPAAVCASFDAPFTRRELLGALARAAVQGSTIAELEAVADAVLYDAALVAPSGWRPRVLGGGRTAFPSGAPEQTYTTSAIEQAQGRVATAVARAEPCRLAQLPRRSGLFLALAESDHEVAEAMISLGRSGRPVRVTGADATRAEHLAQLSGALPEREGLPAVLRSGGVRVVLGPEELGARALAPLVDAATRGDGSVVLVLCAVPPPRAGDRVRHVLRERSALLGRKGQGAARENPTGVARRDSGISAPKGRRWSTPGVARELGFGR